MTPGARVATAIGLLEAWERDEAQLDRLLAGWGRASRFAGSKDRRAVADLVYDAVRRWRSSAWVGGGNTARHRMIGALRLAGQDPRALFTGEGHAPAPLSGDEAAPAPPLDGAPRGVRLDIPDWLDAALAGLPDAALALMRERAPLDLRVNLLKTTVAAAQRALAAEDIDTVPAPLSPTALRVVDGAVWLQATRAFREGLVEPMDAASQAVADFAAPAAGEAVLDFCAGAGGKALALAALTGNGARLQAHDADPGRLARLGPRAARAGARIETLSPGAWRRCARSMDLTLVDAPCSGSGTWRRQPDAKWRLTRRRLADLAALQARILDDAATTVRPGGRLVYATCSLLAAENRDQVDAFLERHPAFRCEAVLALSPLDGGDGFFAARIIRPK